MGMLRLQNASPDRHRLLLLLLIPAVVFTLQLQFRFSEAACDKVRNVLVVGAGISGVAAARHIAVTNGECFKVTVLEARNRVGGRMWSRTEPAPAAGVGSGGVIRGEMGAQWIQSSTGNPITALARRFKLNIGEQNGEEIQYRAGGKAYTDFQLKVASAKYDWALKRAKQIANNQDNDISMEKAFRAAGNFLNPHIQPDPELIPLAFPSWRQSRVAVDFEFEYAGDLSTLSAWYYEDDAFQPPDLVVTNGYDNIPKKLMELIPHSPSPTPPLLHTPTSLLSLSCSLCAHSTSSQTSLFLTPLPELIPHSHPNFPPLPRLPRQEATDAGAQLVLNFEVTAIMRLTSGAVQITGKDTSTGATRSYTGDAAIITLPLGVLKAGVVTFSPALSARKQGAIRRVGFGDVNKVFFFYNSTFWPTWADEYFIEDAQLPGNRGRWVDWVNLKRAWGMTALEGVAKE
ncbi:unnamed protein product [Closterium sp. NIES-64]|nr:unnamed protein product [Closterium sp. NIES-64]